MQNDANCNMNQAGTAGRAAPGAAKRSPSVGTERVTTWIRPGLTRNGLWTGGRAALGAAAPVPGLQAGWGGPCPSARTQTDATFGVQKEFFSLELITSLGAESGPSCGAGVCSCLLQGTVPHSILVQHLARRGFHPRWAPCLLFNISTSQLLGSCWVSPQRQPQPSFAIGDGTPSLSGGALQNSERIWGTGFLF